MRASWWLSHNPIHDSDVYCLDTPHTGRGRWLRVPVQLTSSSVRWRQTTRWLTGPNGEFAAPPGGGDLDPTFGVDAIPRGAPDSVLGLAYFDADGTYRYGHRLIGSPLLRRRWVGYGFEAGGDLIVYGAVELPGDAPAGEADVDPGPPTVRLTNGQFLARWTRDKRVAWTRAYDVAGAAMAVDTEGILTVGAHVRLPNGGPEVPGQPNGQGDVLVRSYSLVDGQPRWMQWFGGPGAETGEKLRLNAEGHLLIAGRSPAKPTSTRGRARRGSMATRRTRAGSSRRIRSFAGSAARHRGSMEARRCPRRTAAVA